jgi:predicted small lipoprotein YifL
VISCTKSSPNKAYSRAGALALAALIAFAASGCGRRGPLEAPPDPSATAKPQDSAHMQVHRQAPPIMPPKDPFILDPLL